METRFYKKPHSTIFMHGLPAVTVLREFRRMNPSLNKSSQPIPIRNRDFAVFAARYDATVFHS